MRYIWPMRDMEIIGPARFLTRKERNQIEEAFDECEPDLGESGMAFVGTRRISWERTKDGIKLNMHREKA